MIEITQEERDFILQALSRIQIGITDPNAQEVTRITSSIIKKLTNPNTITQDIPQQVKGDN